MWVLLSVSVSVLCCFLVHSYSYVFLLSYLDLSLFLSGVTSVRSTKVLVYLLPMEAQYPSTRAEENS